MSSRPEQVVALARQIRGEQQAHIWPLLAGHAPEVQGAALADLLAIWLAGHHVAGDEYATRSLRAELLAMHCAAVRTLTAINALMMGTTP
jgi:hypothetical protein